jgi:2-C-methyl-D-erythritol 4-phosphate cytidylyltransferase
MIIGIILAAGTSSRFESDIPKQIYCINGVPMIEHLIIAMSGVVDTIIVVKNNKVNYSTVNANIVILENNINERKASLNTAILYIKENLKKAQKVVIHDAARPFVTRQYFKELVNHPSKYVQYGLKLTNGLYSMETNLPVSRDSYIELCTPICLSYDLLKIQKTDELINSIDITPTFLFGHYSILRKITTLLDL